VNRQSKVNEQEMGRFEVIVSVFRSVAGRRLVETENPSSCAAVTWKLCNSDSPVLIVI
jgi:hypothetical protein